LFDFKAKGEVSDDFCCHLQFPVSNNSLSLSPLNIIIMRDLLYVIAVILIIGWLVGFFAFHAGGIIHILLVIAVIAILLRIIQGKRVL